LLDQHLINDRILAVEYSARQATNPPRIQQPKIFFYHLVTSSYNKPPVNIKAWRI